VPSSTDPSDEEIHAANEGLSTGPPHREHDENRQVERTQWQRRFQTLTLDQYKGGERFDYRGPPDMKEYVGQKVGRGLRPVREPSPTPRFDPNFPYWQKPLHERRPGEAIITYTPPMTSSEKKNARRGKTRRPD
jgi:hypothetical protein